MTSPSPLLVFALAVGGCTSCAHASTGPTAASVYDALVTSGCMTPSPDGPQAIADSHALAAEPPWLACMFGDGGTVASCAVPCAPPDAGP